MSGLDEYDVALGGLSERARSRLAEALRAADARPRPAIVIGGSSLMSDRIHIRVDNPHDVDAVTLTIETPDGSVVLDYHQIRDLACMLPRQAGDPQVRADYQPPEYADDWVIGHESNHEGTRPDWPFGNGKVIDDLLAKMRGAYSGPVKIVTLADAAVEGMTGPPHPDTLH